MAPSEAGRAAESRAKASRLAAAEAALAALPDFKFVSFYTHKGPAGAAPAAASSAACGAKQVLRGHGRVSDDGGDMPASVAARPPAALAGSSIARSWFGAGAAELQSALEHAWTGAHGQPGRPEARPGQQEQHAYRGPARSADACPLPPHGQPHGRPALPLQLTKDAPGPHACGVADSPRGGAASNGASPCASPGTPVRPQPLYTVPSPPGVQQRSGSPRHGDALRPSSSFLRRATGAAAHGNDRQQSPASPSSSGAAAASGGRLVNASSGASVHDVASNRPSSSYLRRAAAAAAYVSDRRPEVQSRSCSAGEAGIHSGRFAAGGDGDTSPGGDAGVRPAPGDLRPTAAAPANSSDHQELSSGNAGSASGPCDAGATSPYTEGSARHAAGTRPSSSYLRRAAAAAAYTSSAASAAGGDQSAPRRSPLNSIQAGGFARPPSARTLAGKTPPIRPTAGRMPQSQPRGVSHDPRTPPVPAPPASRPHGFVRGFLKKLTQGRQRVVPV
mmetsp:Transcript_7834/g.23559  ORF Transcript_7834/g.23559 Transcript_7834/m.23559 type:complete len:504 (-) Transcript_7834:389-1900(-)